MPVVGDGHVLRPARDELSVPPRPGDPGRTGKIVTVGRHVGIEVDEAEPVPHGAQQRRHAFAAKAGAQVLLDDDDGPATGQRFVRHRMGGEI